MAKTEDQGAKAGIKENLLQVLDASLEVKQAREDKWEQQSVHLESFGAQSSQGGWRLSMTEQREIPLDTRGLKLIIAHKKGEPVSMKLRAVAEIEVLSDIDKWLTWAFGVDKDIAPTLTYTISSA